VGSPVRRILNLWFESIFVPNDESPKIELDLDRQRIKDVLGAAYDHCRDTLEAEFFYSKEIFVSKIDVYLDSNRVAIPVTLPLPSKKFPELLIEVNLRRKKVFARMANKNKQANLNYYLNIL
jgi:hypothetical protein